MKKVIYSFIFLFCAVLTLQAETMVVATYNLRNANGGDSTNGNGWGQRYPYIAQIVQFHGFDIFGTQEGKYPQLQDLRQAMPGYDYIGVGRDDGKRAGEHSAIFYRTDKFEVLEHGDFWLSEITDRPNKGWDAVLPRICTWGEFRDKQTGFTFLFFNLHMDHVGVQARAESAKLILEKIKEFPKKLPAILTGDFNVDQTSESYQLLDGSGIMRDSYEIADFRYAPNGTFNGFHPDRKTDSRIDHLFLTKEFEVKKYGILTDTYRSEAKESARTFPATVRTSCPSWRAMRPLPSAACSGATNHRPSAPCARARGNTSRSTTTSFCSMWRRTPANAPISRSINPRSLPDCAGNGSSGTSSCCPSRTKTTATASRPIFRPTAMCRHD